MKSKFFLPVTCALLLAGCQTSVKLDGCGEFYKLKPSSQSAVFLSQNDLDFAKQIAVHNKYGQKVKCWK